MAYSMDVGILRAQDNLYYIDCPADGHGVTFDRNRACKMGSRKRNSLVGKYRWMEVSLCKRSVLCIVRDAAVVKLDAYPARCPLGRTPSGLPFNCNFCIGSPS
jgi:hypothetical protein